MLQIYGESLMHGSKLAGRVGEGIYVWLFSSAPVLGFLITAASAVKVTIDLCSGAKPPSEW